MMPGLGQEYLTQYTTLQTFNSQITKSDTRPHTKWALRLGAGLLIATNFTPVWFVLFNDIWSQ